MSTSTITAFILGVLASIMLALAFLAGQHQTMEETKIINNKQILLDTKVHLVEMKVDVITEQKDTTELRAEYRHIMEVLAQSQQYTGDGIIARDQSIRNAASKINDSIATGGSQLTDAIESLLRTIENNLHTHDAS